MDDFGLPVPISWASRPVADVSPEPGSLIVTVERMNRVESAPAWIATELGIQSESLQQAVADICNRHRVNLVFSDPDVLSEPEEGTEGPNQVKLWLRPKALGLMESHDNTSLTPCDRELNEHLGLAGKAAQRISERLSLDHNLAGAVVEAARLHDLGKAERRWQEAIGNPNPDRPMAKRKTSAFDQRRNDGYRHELGSLVRAQGIDELASHLIAAHHGWARPVFSDKATRKPGCRVPGDTAVFRFARLQARYGLWGLAYLEALMRCADVQAELLAQQLNGGLDVD